MLDLLFPPLCVICKERFEKKPFCPLCWDLCSLIDPVGRCPHCFEESQELCSRCRKKPWLVFTKAFVFEAVSPAFYLLQHHEDLMASFMICQWARLNWPVPDLVIAMPFMEMVAIHFSEKIQRPCLFFENQSLEDMEKIEEDLILLILDRGGLLESQKKVVQLLCATFPKRGYLLSLFSHDTFDF